MIQSGNESTTCKVLVEQAMRGIVNHAPDGTEIRVNRTSKLLAGQAIGAVDGNKNSSADRIKSTAKTAPIRELVVGQTMGGNNSSPDGVICTTNHNTTNISPTMKTKNPSGQRYSKSSKGKWRPRTRNRNWKKSSKSCIPIPGAYS